MVADFELASAAALRQLRERIADLLHSFRKAIAARLVLLAVYPICLVASLYAAWRMFYLIGKNPDKAWVMAVAHDQLGNAAMNGNPDETISSRADRARTAGRRWGCIICGLLDRLDPNHCRKSAGK
jgi:hypothetical protein